MVLHIERSIMGIKTDGRPHGPRGNSVSISISISISMSIFIFVFPILQSESLCKMSGNWNDNVGPNGACVCLDVCNFQFVLPSGPLLRTLNLSPARYTLANEMGAVIDLAGGTDVENKNSCFVLGLSNQSELNKWDVLTTLLNYLSTWVICNNS